MHSATTSYRADIDGLRAIAVLSVVLFHAYPVLLPGGFVGVDVFFVISGYLISGIILTEIQSNNFDIATFYLRRCRRILPPLILVFVASLIFGRFYLFLQEYKKIASSVVDGGLFVFNFRLLKEISYFDSGSKAEPFLHIWSLSVEEQFYFLWPFTILLFSRLKTRITNAFFAIFIISFMLNLCFINRNPNATFYMLPTRLWELLTGAILASLRIYKSEINHGTRSLWSNLNGKLQFQKVAAYFVTPVDPEDSMAPQAGQMTMDIRYLKFKPYVLSLMNDVKSLLGLFLIIISTLIIDGHKPYPGWCAIIPTLGAALIISSGQNAIINRWILVQKPIVYIGLISYPLYLWHWPIIVFAKTITNNNITNYSLLFLIIIAVLLSAISYHVFEKPIKTWVEKSSCRCEAREKVCCIFIALLFTVATARLLFNSIQRGEWREKFSPIESQFDFAYANDSCKTKLKNFNEYDYCLFGDKFSNPGVAIIGDSHAQMLYVGLSPIYEANGIGVVNLGMGGCPPLWDTNIEQVGKETGKCLASFQKIIDYLVNQKSIKVIILGVVGYMDNDTFYIKKRKLTNTENQWKNPDNTRAFTVGLLSTIKYLQARGKRIILFRQVPELGFDPRFCIDRPARLKFTDKKDCMVSKSEVDFKMGEFSRLLDKALYKTATVCVFDPTNYFSKNGFYFGIHDGNLLYRDSSHLSRAGSHYIAKKFSTSRCFKESIATARGHNFK